MRIQIRQSSNKPANSTDFGTNSLVLEACLVCNIRQPEGVIEIKVLLSKINFCHPS